MRRSEIDGRLPFCHQHAALLLRVAWHANELGGQPYWESIPLGKRLAFPTAREERRAAIKEHGRMLSEHRQLLTDVEPARPERSRRGAA